MDLAVLYAAAAAASQALDEEGALDDGLRRMLDLLGLRSGRIFLPHARGGELFLAASAGVAPAPSALDTEQPCLCCSELSLDRPLLMDALSSDPRVALDRCREHEDRVCCTVPLVAHGRMLGLLHVSAGPETALSNDYTTMLRAVGAQIGVSIENMRLREEARRADALSTLLAEMHHRIKNNLQTVADLLSLEMLNSSSPEAQRSLHDSINRIKSIAAVHKLLSVEQLRLTDITQLAREVCDIALGHLSHPRRAAVARVSGPPIFLPSKQATALALVMNELISNALEHAFRDDQRNRLTIVLAHEGARISVTVTDNGAGFPPGFVLSQDAGLGLRIVETLVEKDLGGTLEFRAPLEGGTSITLSFYQ